MKLNVEHWYVACRSKELRGEPISRTLLSTPIVLFRDSTGKPAALLDRCPHRNVPLSMGCVVKDYIQCGYHGWEFSSDGKCKKIPGLEGVESVASRSVEWFDVKESQGFVWVFSKMNTKASFGPFTLPEDRTATEVSYSSTVKAPLFYVLENMLDVPHTTILHKGLFRNEGQGELQVLVRRVGSKVEAEYVGEKRPTGILGKLLAPKGGEVRHIDRFIYPSIAQVEYRLGSTYVLATSLLTPETDEITKIYASTLFKVKVPRKLVETAGYWISKKILKQDALILEEQKKNVERFHGEAFSFTKADILGPHIQKLIQNRKWDEEEEKKFTLKL